MALDRRHLLALGLVAPFAAPGLVRAQTAPLPDAPPAATPEAPAAPAAPPAGTIAPNDPRLSERGIGRPDAPVKVIEFFSLTCSHCAAFHRNTFPRVKRELVETGAIRLIWRDFPLDGLALAAAAVARSLPEARYEGFIGALLNSQDRWAFTRGDPVVELGKMAGLAGMARPQFEAVMADEALRRAIMEQRMQGDQEFHIQATPSFVFGTRTQSGDMPFDTFLGHVEAARRG